jgi:ABC-type multidrug transport system fused ATPase/permease subunit
LPFGYDTIIGDQGIKLSGGQRQRLCIARAFLKNAPVLILDEATSQLDIASETKIFDAIKSKRNDRINIFITHRLGSISFVDKILLLHDGKIIDEGDHQSLMEDKGNHFSMNNLNLSGNHAS